MAIEIGHTDTCLAYAAKTGKSFCIAECAEYRGKVAAEVVALEAIKDAAQGLRLAASQDKPTDAEWERVDDAWDKLGAALADYDLYQALTK